MSAAPHADILPAELAARLAAGEALCIVDVREPAEHAASSIPGSLLIPLGELPARWSSAVDPDAEIVVHCKLGGRASQAAAFLRQQGCANVRNLRGGITAWLEQPPPS